MADVAISFDDDFQIRVLEADKFKETDKLREECSAFTSSEYSEEGVLPMPASSPGLGPLV